MNGASSDEQLILALLAMELDSVIEIGNVPAVIHHHWKLLTTEQLVITGRQLDHIRSTHFEMMELVGELILTMRYPDEIHRDHISDTSAIFWKALDPEGMHWLRASISLATQDKGPEKANSLITAWRIRRRGYLHGVNAGRRLWRKGES